VGGSAALTTILTLKGSPASFSVSAPLTGVDAKFPEPVYVMFGAVAFMRSEIAKKQVATQIAVASVLEIVIIQFSLGGLKQLGKSSLDCHRTEPRPMPQAYQYYSIPQQFQAFHGCYDTPLADGKSKDVCSGSGLIISIVQTKFP
jgi:hypothetical protein